MHVFLLGVSHQTAPVDLREQLDFSSRDVGAAVEALAARSSAGEAVVLSTCNRSEIYVASDDPARARRSSIEFLGSYHELPRRGVRAARLRPHRRGRRAAPVPRRRRARLAGRRRAADPRPGQGRVPGGRGAAVRRAGADAALPLLVRRRQARAHGNRARRRRGLGGLCRGGAGAQDLRPARRPRRARGRRRRDQHADRAAPARAGRRRDRRSPAGPPRTPRRSPRRWTAAPSPGAICAARSPRADIVITATGSQRPIITRADVEAVSGRRRGEPLFIIDIAVPRDVDAVGRRDRAGVPLQRRRPAGDRPGEPEPAVVGDRPRRSRSSREEVERFAAWQRSRGAVPTVVALRQRFEQIRRAELQRLESKLGGLPPEARASVDEVTRLIVEKLLLDAHRAAQGAARRGNADRLHRGGQPAVRAARRDAAERRPRTRRWTPSRPNRTRS